MKTDARPRDTTGVFPIPRKPRSLAELLARRPKRKVPAPFYKWFRVRQLHPAVYHLVKPLRAQLGRVDDRTVVTLGILLLRQAVEHPTPDLVDYFRAAAREYQLH
jgi:hypothetical protein